MTKNHSQAVRLIQISDSHCYADDDSKLEWSDIPVYPNKSLQRVLTHIGKHAHKYDALVISGDLVQEETAASYARVGQLLQGFPLPIYILPGNHDVPALMQSQLVEQDDNIHFQLHQIFTNWHCLFLDTHLIGHPDGHLNNAKFAEIDNQLQQLKPKEHALIFMHHHPVPIGSPWMDTMGLQQAEEFWTLLSQYPQVQSVVFGHIHSEFSTQHQLSDKHHEHTVAVYGTPATCVQVLHIDENLRLDHTRPAWRELTLYPNGDIETQVDYLPDE